MKDKCLQSKSNPRDAKIDLAHELITRFHGQKKADKAKENFINRFQNKNITEDIPQIDVMTDGKSLSVIDLITRKLKAIASTSEARRLISQNAIKINSTPVTSIDYDCSKQKNFFLQIGKKKAYKISLKE